MSARRCPEYPDGIHRFTRKGKTMTCTCGHELEVVNDA